MSEDLEAYQKVLDREYKSHNARMKRVLTAEQSNAIELSREEREEAMKDFYENGFQ